MVKVETPPQLPVEKGLIFPLKVASDRINADIVNPLLADDEGRDPVLGYDALEACAPTAGELLCEAGEIPPADA